MSDESCIDIIDFLILKCLQEHDAPLWKNRIHEHHDGFGESASVQTIGRRVDTLVEEEYLDSCIVSPDDINRDLIIAYKLTEKGRAALRQKRRDMLEEAVCSNLFCDAETLACSKAELVDLICNEFDYPDAVREHLKAEYTEQEIVTVLALDLLNKEATAVFGDTEPVKRFHDVVLDERELSHFYDV